jgi:hypothetical protein
MTVDATAHRTDLQRTHSLRDVIARGSFAAG